MGNIFNIILIAPLVNALVTIYAFLPGHDFGMSIIIFTFIIRLALWPLAGKQLHSQKKIQAIQPEIAKIKAKAKGDKQKESAMLMELYKEKEVNPFSSCLPAVLQFPVLIAMYVVFQQATTIGGIEKLLYSWVKNFPFVSQVLNNHDLFNPTLFGLLSMAKPSPVLAVIAGLTQYVQVKMITPKKQPGVKDTQAQMTSTMTLLFPFVTVFIAWGLPAALPLYWIVTNGVAIFQQFLIKRHEVEVMEETPMVTTKKRLAKPTQKKLPAPKLKKKKGKK